VIQSLIKLNKKMEQAFIIDGIRTPIGNFKGALSGVRADDLAALVIQKLMERNPSVPTDKIEDVIFGCANQAGDDNRNVARMALLLACIGHVGGGTSGTGDKSK
jgi:acetyl-CoA acyltransferase